MSSKAKDREIIGVQYLRAFAAIGVVMYHTASISTFPKYFGFADPSPALHYSAAGVDVFFLISGFIITLVSVDERLQPRSSMRTFASKRFGRIVPLMWFAILSYAALRFVGRGTLETIPYLRALTLFPSGQLMPNVIWTLRHEAIFYFVFALTIYGPSALRFVLPLWVVSPIVVYVAGASGSTWYASNTFLRILMSPVNVEFGTGVLIGWAFLVTKPKPLLGGNRAGLAVVFTASLLFLIALVLLDREPHETFPQAIVTALVAAPLLLLAILIDCERDPLQAFGRLLGAASYSIYLFHEHVVSALLGVLKRVAPHLPAGIVIPLTAVVAVAAGCVIHLMIERPLVTKVQAALGRKRVRSDGFSPLR